MAINPTGLSQIGEEEKDSLALPTLELESPFVESPLVESPLAQSPTIGQGYSIFGEPETAEEELSWWEKRQLEDEEIQEGMETALEEDDLLRRIMDGDGDALEELANIGEDLQPVFDKSSEFLTLKYLSDTYDISEGGAKLLYDWYAQGGSTVGTAKLIDTLPGADWRISAGISGGGPVVVSELAPIDNFVEGDIIYNDDGTIKDIIFPDAPTSTINNPVGSFKAGVKEAEQRAIIEEDLARREMYTSAVQNVLNLGAFIKAVDMFKDNPNVSSGVIAAHTGIKLAESAGLMEAGSGIATFVSSAYYVVLADALIQRYLVDHDYARSEGTVGFKDGKFYTAGARGADDGTARWGQVHADVASKYLNKLADRYNLEINEDAVNTALAGGYIGSNPQYNSMGSNRRGSAQQLYWDVFKSGAFIVTPETDVDFYLKPEEVATRVQREFNNMQNEISYRLLRNSGGLADGYGAGSGFTSEEVAVRYMNRLNAEEEVIVNPRSLSQSIGYFSLVDRGNGTYGLNKQSITTNPITGVRYLQSVDTTKRMGSLISARTLDEDEMIIYEVERGGINLSGKYHRLGEALDYYDYNEYFEGYDTYQAYLEFRRYREDIGRFGEDEFMLQQMRAKYQPDPYAFYDQSQKQREVARRYMTAEEYKKYVG